MDRELPEIKMIDSFFTDRKNVVLWLLPNNSVELEIYDTITLKTIESFNKLDDDEIALKFEELKAELLGDHRGQVSDQRGYVTPVQSELFSVEGGGSYE
ncbi:hypothetical protein H8E88_16625 [candidate division KSB1 bacterium]|nr:hypothetical protein [candidate division KSB1 bacterium]